MFSKLVIPLDGSRTAENVLPDSRYLAGRLKIPVELFSVIDVVEVAINLSAEKSRLVNALIEERVSNRENYLRGVAATFPGNEIKYRLEKGVPAERITEQAGVDKSILINMATHGHTGLTRWLLGSVAEKVLRSTVNPTLLVRATAEAKTAGEATLKTIIVPLDGSELAENVLPMVADLAQRLGLEVLLFRAYHIPYAAIAGDGAVYAINYEELIASIRAEANEYLRMKAAEVKKLGIEKISYLAKEGFAADEIIALGAKTPYSLIAMCSHGRSGAKRWVLGSVTETVVRHSSDPALVIRGKS